MAPTGRRGMWFLPLHLCSLFAAWCGGVRAFGDGGDVPAFVREETRANVQLVHDHTLREFARGDFGGDAGDETKQQAFVGVMTSACAETDVEAFKKGLLWDVRGMLGDSTLARTNIGVYMCFQDDYKPLCEAVFGADVNARACEFYVVPADGERLRMFSGKEPPTQASLTAFLKYTDPALSVEAPSGTQLRFKCVALLIEWMNFRNDVTYLSWHPLFPAVATALGAIVGLFVLQLCGCCSRK